MPNLNFLSSSINRISKTLDSFLNYSTTQSLIRLEPNIYPALTTVLILSLIMMVVLMYRCINPQRKARKVREARHQRKDSVPSAYPPGMQVDKLFKNQQTHGVASRDNAVPQRRDVQDLGVEIRHRQQQSERVTYDPRARSFVGLKEAREGLEG